MQASSSNYMLGQTDRQLIRRVNQLYHELTQPSFDHEHRRRHRVERPFWQGVFRYVLEGPKGLRKSAGTKAAERGAVLAVDLACGTGFVTEIMGDRLGRADRLLAIDLSSANLKRAEHKWIKRSSTDSAHPPLGKTVADALALPLAANSVDILAVNAALHHIPDPLAGLREIDRVLKPGGFFALGFEPNRTHFASAAMVGISRGLERLSWYASPQQNCRRLGQMVNGKCSAHSLGEAALAEAINPQLMRDGLIATPMPTAKILDLVDIHARGAERQSGFEPAELLREAMGDYQVHILFSSDYLGASGRRLPNVRRVVDAMFRAFIPGHGSLFSWLISKPNLGVLKGNDS